MKETIKERMKRSVVIQTEAINEAGLAAAREVSPGAGAVISFLGIVRAAEGKEMIEAIEYEAFQKMALHQFGKILDEMERRWPRVESIRLAHRIGVVRVGEASLWVEAAAPHRAEAFAACQFLIDQMKQFVPIWKKPITAPNAPVSP